MMHTHADGTRHRDLNRDHHDHGHDDHTVRGGPPVLDIGGDVGAMVVRMDAAAAGSELHLRSEHQPAVHTGVWSRAHGTVMITVAVFPELVAGRYWVLDGEGNDVRLVVIGGGELTEIDLRRPVAVSAGH